MGGRVVTLVLQKKRTTGGSVTVSAGDTPARACHMDAHHVLVEQRTKAVDQAVGQAAAGALHGHSRAPHDDADALQHKGRETPRLACVHQTHEAAGCLVLPPGTDHLCSAHVESPAARTASHPEAAPVTRAIHTCLEQKQACCKPIKWHSPARPASRPGHPPAAAAPGTALQKGCSTRVVEKCLRG